MKADELNLKDEGRVGRDHRGVPALPVPVVRRANELNDLPS